MLPSPAGREASSGGGAPSYVRHRPEPTLLYRLVEEYYPSFKAHLAVQGTDLPGYVEQEFEDYLKCGRLGRYLERQGLLERRASMTRAQRLKRVFNIDIETCPACGGSARIVACIEDPEVIGKILAHLAGKTTDLEATRPPSRGLPQLGLFG